jgi:hypothetical protein
VEVEEVVCETAGREEAREGGGEGPLGTAGVVGGRDGRGGGGTFVIGGAAGAAEVAGCLLRRRSRCLGFSFSAFMGESCKAEKKARA